LSQDAAAARTDWTWRGASSHRQVWMTDRVGQALQTTREILEARFGRETARHLARLSNASAPPATSCHVSRRYISPSPLSSRATPR
jgi:hypothetical protein